MSKSTGPIIVAGGITWANNVLLDDQYKQEDLFTSSVRIGLATGLAAALLYGVESALGDLATALSWAALVTVLFVRVGNNPTPLERALTLVGG